MYIFYNNKGIDDHECKWDDYKPFITFKGNEIEGWAWVNTDEQGT